MDQFIDGLARVIAVIITWVGDTLLGVVAVVVGYTLQCLILVALVMPAVFLVNRIKAKRGKTP